MVRSPGGPERFLLGANYWPRRAALRMWRDYDPEETRKELNAARSLGLDAIRTFITWADFQPEPNRVDERMIQRFDQFLLAAREAGLGVIPTFFCGHMSGENWDVPWRAGRNPYSDPSILRAQAALVAFFARRYAKEPAIAFWDLANEPDAFARPSDRDSGWLWARLLAAEIRRYDTRHPVTVGLHTASLLEDNGLLPADLAESLDFLCMHAYPLYCEMCPERLDGVRSTYLVPFCCALTGALGRGAGVLFEEFGATTQMVADELVERYVRTTLHGLVAEGALGAFGWCLTDFSTSEELPYDTTPYEVGFGALGTGLTRKGAGRAIADFSRALDACGLRAGEYRPARRSVAILIPRRYYDNYDRDISPERNMRVLFNSYILARRAGLNPQLVLPDEDIHCYKAVLLPSVPRRGSLNNSDWRRVREFVKSGGTLFMSYDGVALEGMGDVFGMDVRYPVNDGPGTCVHLRHERERGTESTGIRTRNETGRRLAVAPIAGKAVWAHTDREGAGCAEPAVVVNRYGEGHAVFCDFALEASVSRDVEVHTREEVHRIYRYVAELAGRTEPAYTDCPDVSATVLENGDARRVVVVVNFSHEQKSVGLVCPGAARLHDPVCGASHVPNARGYLPLTLGPNGANLLELEASVPCGSKS